MSSPAHSQPLRFGVLPRDRMRRTASRWHDESFSGLTFALTPSRTPPVSVGAAAADAIAGSANGVYLFYSAAESHLVIPPFPVERAVEREGWHTGPLLSHLDRPRTVAVLLLRLGGFAVGVFEGERLTISKVGSTFVKGRHKKGGSSSGRFARRREGQARMLYDKACETLRERIEPVLDSIEYFAVGGDRLTLTDFEKRCAFVRRLAGRRLPTVLNVPDPRLRVLEGVGRDLYSCRVASFTPPPVGGVSP